jgi:hypothetical protein
MFVTSAMSTISTGMTCDGSSGGRVLDHATNVAPRMLA